MTNLSPSKGVTTNDPLSQTFQFDNTPVRTIDRENQIWFFANDVCTVLEISNPRNATARLDEDEKGVHNTDTLGGSQETTIISESGLYNLIFRSRKAQAQRFRKWVTSEVLPAIRKTGNYNPQPAQAALPPPNKKNSPDFARAADMSAQAAKAAFEAVLTNNQSWLNNARFLLTMQLVSSSGERRPQLKPVPHDAYVASLPKFTEMIKNGAFTSPAELAELAAVCNQRLSRHWEYNS